MERTSTCCTFALLVALVLLVLLPVKTWCKEDVYKSQTEAKPECCVSGDEFKRYDDMDYNSFVSLMGRRSAAQPNSHRNTKMSRKENMDHVLAALLGRRTNPACPCGEEYLQTKSRRLAYGRQRIQRFL